MTSYNNKVSDYCLCGTARHILQLLFNQVLPDNLMPQSPPFSSYSPGSFHHCSSQHYNYLAVSFMRVWIVLIFTATWALQSQCWCLVSISEKLKVSLANNHCPEVSLENQKTLYLELTAKTLTWQFWASYIHLYGLRWNPECRMLAFSEKETSIAMVFRNWVFS